MKNLKNDMLLYLDNAEPVYNAAEELAALDKEPTSEQLNGVAKLLLQTMTNETGERYDALDVRDAMVVVAEWIKEEQTEL